MKKISSIILTVVIIIVLAGVVVLISRNKAADGLSANVLTPLDVNAKLTGSESDYDFGDVSMSKGLVEHDFVLTNSSSEALDIEEVWTSCMCTEVLLQVGDKEVGPFGMPGHGVQKSAGLSVQPGETLLVKTEFDPAAHGPAGIGPVKRNIYLKVGEVGQVVLGFTATVTP